MADYLSEEERSKYKPLADARIADIMNALSGHYPATVKDNQEGKWALQSVFGVDFNEALDEYIKYQRGNIISKKLKDLAIGGAIKLYKNSYLGDVRKALDDQIRSTTNSVGPDLSKDYTGTILLNLKNALNQPDTTDQIVKSIMNYRDLNQPIPKLNMNIVQHRMGIGTGPLTQPQQPPQE